MMKLPTADLLGYVDQSPWRFTCNDGRWKVGRVEVVRQSWRGFGVAVSLDMSMHIYTPLYF